MFESILVPMLVKWAQDSNPGKFVESVILILIAFAFLIPFLKGVVTVITKNMDKNINALGEAFKETSGQLKEHLNKVEGQLTSMISAIDNVRKALVTLEFNHAKEIKDLKENYLSLSERVSNVETRDQNQQ